MAACMFDLELPNHNGAEYMEDVIHQDDDMIDLTEEIVESNHYKVGKNDFDILKVIGKGGYGTVYLVRKVTGADRGAYLAMKELKKAAIVKNQKDTAHTKTERNILEAVKHPFIVELYYAFQTNRKLYLIMEFLNGGELFKLLDNEGVLDNDDARFYICEITLALQHLHSLNIIYRDLKPENILLDSAGHIKLADFGLCKEDINEKCTTNTFCGTIEYMAPEILKRSGHGKAADWWSLGTLLYDMLSGRSPFTSNQGPQNRKKTIDAILSRRITFPRYFHPITKNFIQRLLKRSIAQRLGSGPTGAEEIKSDHYFKLIDWNQVIRKGLRPPYVPRLSGADDVSQFDRKFTQEIPVESPVTDSPMDANPFAGFSFTAQCMLVDEAKAAEYDTSLVRSAKRQMSTEDDSEEMEAGGIDIPRNGRRPRY